MEIRMDGRVAVVTGASTGLGFAVAREFVASGASVAMLARRQDVLDAAAAALRALASQGARVAAYACDVARPAPIAARSTSWSTMPASAPRGLSTRPAMPTGRPISISSCSPRSG